MAQARDLQTLLPKAPLHVLAGLGHIPQIEDPAAFNPGPDRHAAHHVGVRSSSSFPSAAARQELVDAAAIHVHHLDAPGAAGKTLADIRQGFEVLEREYEEERALYYAENYEKVAE